MYLSRATRSSMRRMIFTVVSTPTSDEMSTSSRSSSTSASTVERPATARASFEKSPVLVFSSPAFSSSWLRAACSTEGVSCFFLKMSKNPIIEFLYSPHLRIALLYGLRMRPVCGAVIFGKDSKKVSKKTLSLSKISGRYCCPGPSGKHGPQVGWNIML